MDYFPSLIADKIQWYVWENSRAKGYATLHLVRLGKYPKLWCLVVKQLYPDFAKHVKRGDIIENIDESGYRSEGVYMVDIVDDKVMIIYLENSADDYGSPSKNFEGISQFPLDYWDYSKITINNRWVPERKYAESYWHDDNVPVAIYPYRIGLTFNNQGELDWKMGSKYLYHVWSFRGRPHIVIRDLEQDLNIDEHFYGFFDPNNSAVKEDSKIHTIVSDLKIRKSEIITLY